MHAIKTHTAFKICKLLAIENKESLLKVSVDFPSFRELALLDRLIQRHCKYVPTGG